MEKKLKYKFGKMTFSKAIAIISVMSIVYVLFFLMVPDHIKDMHSEIGNPLIFILMDLIALCLSAWLIIDFNDNFVNYLDAPIPWEKKPFNRLILQVFGTSIVGFLLIIFFMSLNAVISVLIYPQLIDLVKEEEWNNLAERSFHFFIAISVIYHSIYIGTHFYKRWANSLLESEKLKMENLHAQLHTLQSQVNPHFLFNSLNTLTSVIDEDRKEAIEYVQKISSFYRYLMQRQTNHLVLLNDELAFVDSYIYLQKKRFGDNFNVMISLDEEAKKKFIPTFVLQILLENTVKHNVVSSEKPLFVKIFIDINGNLVVENNLQRKNFVEPSTEHGLQNIKNRYAILSKRNIQVVEAENVFRVILPLIDERGNYENHNN